MIDAASREAEAIQERKVLLSGTLEPAVRSSANNVHCWKNLTKLARADVRMFWDVCPQVRVLESVSERRGHVFAWLDFEACYPIPNMDVERQNHLRFLC